MRETGIESRRAWLRQRARALQTRVDALRRKAASAESDEAQRASAERSAELLLAKIAELERDAAGTSAAEEPPVQSALRMAGDALFKCDGCGRRIASERWHCVECANFDLCEECHAKSPQHTAGHPMVRETETSEQLLEAVAGHPTLPEMFAAAFVKYAQRPCLGFRPAAGDGFAPEYTWLSFGDVGRRVHNAKAGLVGLLGLGKGSFVSICGRNTVSWFLADFACALSCCTTAPLHHSVTADTAERILALAESRCVFCHSERVAFFQNLRASGKCPLFAHIVQFEPRDSHTNEDVLTLQELEAYGAQHPVTIERPEDGDLYTVVFTSGSTGQPKGVPYTQKLIARNITVYLNSTYDPFVGISKDSLSHVSDREDVYTILLSGGRVGMLSRIENVFEDVRILSPTSVSATPRWWNVLFSEFQALWQASKKRLLDANPLCSPKDLDDAREQAMDSVRQILGKRIQHVLLGGAAINPEVKAFLRECWGKEKVIEGYGTSEVGNIAGDDGTIRRNVQWRLADCPEMGYSSSDLPFPRGELLVKTDTMIGGYYHEQSGENNALFESDSFFRTGDIVEVVGENRIRIVDRRKNLFKLAQGEFVAPAKVEECLSKCTLVSGVLVTCPSGTHAQNATLAVVVPNEARLRAVLQSPQDAAFSSVCSQGRAQALVLQELRSLGRASGLRPFEIPIGVVLESEPWTSENGLLTPSFKINRPALERKYRSAVNDLAAKLEAASSAAAVAAASSPTGGESESALVLSTIGDVLGIEPALLSGTLSEAFVRGGGDSMSAIRLVSVLKERHNIVISPEALFAATGTGRACASPTAGTGRTSSFAQELLSDSELPAPVDVVRMEQSTELPVDNTFMTGATGFLGVHVLAHALSHSIKAARIWCLIRCSSPEDGLQRLRNALDSHGLHVDEEDLSGRVVVVRGDLSHPGLGISEADRETVVGSCRVFLHCGALVNHVFPYSKLRAANVIGTAEVLRLAAQAGAASFCNVSTLSTITQNDKLLSIGQTLESGGYTQSKWVAEKLAMSQAASLKIPLVTVRPGLVTWSTVTGVANRADWLVRLLRGCSALGCVPRSNSRLHPTPVDFVAHVVWSVATRPGSYAGCSLNVFNALQAVSFVALTKWLASIAQEEFTEGNEMLRGLSQLGTAVHFSVWHDAVERAVSANPGNVDLAGLLLFTDGVPDDGDGPRQIFFPTFAKYPLIDKAYAQKFVHWISSQ